MRKLLSLVIVFVSMNGFAATKSARIQTLVDQYYQSVQNVNPFENQCYPKNDCADAVCDSLGDSDCDDSWEIDEVLKMCRGQYDGGCIRSACRWLGSSDCDDKWEVQEIALACVGNRGGDCIDAVCSRMGSSDCDDKWEMVEIAKKCAGQ